MNNENKAFNIAVIVGGLFAIACLVVLFKEVFVLVALAAIAGIFYISEHGTPKLHGNTLPKLSINYGELDYLASLLFDRLKGYSPIGELTFANRQEVYNNPDNTVKVFEYIALAQRYITDDDLAYAKELCRLKINDYLVQNYFVLAEPEYVVELYSIQRVTYDNVYYVKFTIVFAKNQFLIEELFKNAKQLEIQHHVDIGDDDI